MGHPLQDDLPKWVDRRTLLRLGFSEKSVDHLFRRVALVRLPGDSKVYAQREAILDAVEKIDYPR